MVVGDSIAEGKSEVNLDDAWPLIFVRALKEAFKDVKFNISNLSLAGRGTGNLYSAGYVGIAGPDNPLAGFYYPPGSQSTYHWPAGSAIGKSWREHIRDQAPDLVIAALGMNDVGGSSQDNANVTQSVLDYLASFSKVPSVALMTPMQPAEGFNPVPDMQEKIRQNAEIYRGLADRNDCTLLDANRLSFLYRDAIDVVNTKGHRRTIDGYPSGKPSGWSQLTGPGFSLFGGSLSGGGITQRNELMRDVYIDTTFTLADYATITPILIYRKDSAAPENAYQVVIAGGSKVIVHWQNTCIASQTLAPLPNGQPVRIEVRCRGGRHQVFVNNKKLIDTHNFEKLDDGYTALGIDGGSGLIEGYLTVSFREIKCGQPMFAGGDLYGYVNDFDTNPDSPGGSATNHPSALGHSVLYADACLPLLKVQAPTGAVLFVKAQDLTTDFIGAAPGSSARLSTCGTLGPVGAVPATSGVAALTLFDTQQVAGGQTITVNVQSSTSHGTVAMLSANLVLPSGIWVVSTRATLSRNASGFISFLDAVAMKA